MGPRRAPGPLRQRLLQLVEAAQLLTRGTHALIAGPAGTKTLRTLHMENIKQRALLYVAARFMMVRIDYCAKRQAASYKRQAASNKVSS